MYAIFADGGRQYKVEEGQELEVDYRDVPPGEQVTFDKVLAVSAAEGLKLGQPTVSGAAVTAEVIGPALGDKIYVQKFTRRKNFRRRTGHRQIYTTVRIKQIAPPSTGSPDSPAVESPGETQTLPSADTLPGPAPSPSVGTPGETQT